MKKTDIQQVFSRIPADRAALAACFLLILFVYRKFLLSPEPAGWDTLPQIHLFFKMVKLLKMGMVFGYDFEWFGGFPIFIFYGFLPYLPASAAHVLSGGLLPVLFLAKFTLIGSAFIFLLSFYQFVGTFFGKKARLLGLIILQIYLFLPIDPHIGTGLAGAIHHGMFLNFLGTSLVLWTLVFLEKHWTTKNPKYHLGAVLFFAGCIFSHALSSVAGAMAVTVYFLIRKRFKEWAVFFLWVSALTLFYVYPYLQYAELLNANKMSASYIRLAEIFGLQKDFPAQRLLLLIGFVFGALKLYREKKFFLPVTFLMYLVLVPTNLLYNTLDLSVHYYRLHNFFMLIYVLISIYGLQVFIDSVGAKQVYRGAAFVLLIALVLPMVLSFKYRGQTLDWENELAPEAALVRTIDQLKPTGPVFVERTGADSQPHLFNVYLPMKHQIPVPIGLLMESSNNAGFITPLIRTMSESFVWGKADYKLENPYGEIIEKIQDMGIEYLCLEGLLSQSGIASNLSAIKSLAEIAAVVDPYIIVRVKDPLPLLSRLKHEPVLCINRHPTMSNEEVITALYKMTISPDIKIAFTKKSRAWPSAETLRLFKTVLVIPRENETIPPLGSVRVQAFDPSQAEIAGFLENSVPVTQKTVSIQPESVSEKKIVFTANEPTVVNIGYFPYWLADKGRVFRLSPSKLLVFPEGRTTLRFKIPGLQKLLMLFSLVMLGLLINNSRQLKIER